ncbi:hypothetical protein [Epilithonimonas mollis]|uniref:Uncharacterized protein n=1 Tax=Epilithonimonas mollis TaxID=216903 RepID=A0A1M6U9R0_9FLAO|nr:hypothetical protein [Epilithonimonas mollis]SHK65798.1 hypothetical protein SAMN05444371_3220 [Epilithonimonas mollis]
MKNLITLIILFSGLGLATAQTEAETIAWIKEKIEKYPVDYDKNVVKSINACEITVENYMDNKVSTWIMPTDITGWIAFGPSFKGNVVKHINHLGKVKYVDFISLLDEKREADLASRMMKAILHLNTFCPQKKEVF